MKTLLKIVFSVDQITLEVRKNEVRCFLSEESDDYNIYLEIHAGFERN